MPYSLLILVRYYPTWNFLVLMGPYFLINRKSHEWYSTEHKQDVILQSEACLSPAAIVQGLNNNSQSIVCP